MGPIGVPEMIAIFVIALLLFGPKKLPELGRTLGKAITEFRRASNELKATFESHLSELEKENQSMKESLSPYTAPDYTSSYSYDNDYHTYDPELNPVRRKPAPHNQPLPAPPHHRTLRPAGMKLLPLLMWREQSHDLDQFARGIEQLSEEETHPA